jgi:trans-aconitate methyltransferase
VADVIFSNATFHWILDHDSLFQTLINGPQARWSAGRPMRSGG